MYPRVSENKDVTWDLWHWVPIIHCVKETIVRESPTVWSLAAINFLSFHAPKLSFAYSVVEWYMQCTLTKKVGSKQIRDNSNFSALLFPEVTLNPKSNRCSLNFFVFDEAKTDLSSSNSLDIKLLMSIKSLFPSLLLLLLTWYARICARLLHMVCAGTQVGSV